MTRIKTGTFHEFLDRPGIVAIVWGTSWCVPCAEVEPLLESLASRHPDVHVGAVDADEDPELATALDLQSLPTLTIFRDGTLVHAAPAPLANEDLEEVLARVRALDMDRLHREIADERRDALGLGAGPDTPRA